VSWFLCLGASESFTPGLSIDFVNKKRLVEYLVGGVLVVGLLICGFLLLGPEYLTEDRSDTGALCLSDVKSICSSGADSVNLSELRNCDASYYPYIGELLDSVRSMNESSGVVTCNASAANTSN
jgi:hypothetical protein